MKAWIVGTVAALGGFGSLLMALCLGMFVFSIFGMTMAIKQAERNQQFAARCEKAGGLPYRAKYAPIICLDRAALRPVAIEVER
jgi:uncharacterized membrane protein